MNRFTFWIALGLAALLGSAVVWLATERWGVGISPDSVRYLATAQSLMQGRGFVMLGYECNGVPATQFPPLYPSLLALLGFAGLAPVDGARWLNAITFAANIGWVGWIVHQQTRDPRVALLAALFALNAPNLISVHAMAWSEPVFIFCLLGGIYFLNAWLETRHPWKLGLAALWSALAILERYIGAALILTGALAILWQSRKNLSSRWLDALLHTALGCAPLALWLAGMAHGYGTSSQDRGLAFHPINRNQLQEAMIAFTQWFAPVDFAPRTAMIFSALAAVCLLACCFILFRDRKKHTEWLNCFSRTARVLLLFLANYTALLLISIFIFDAQTAANNRMWTPFFAVLLILGVLVFHRIVQAPSIARYRTFMLALLLLFLMTYIDRAGNLAWILYDKGSEYSSQAWRESVLLSQLKALPSGIPIYSNLEEAIYFPTGPCAYRLPPKFNWYTLARNDNYPIEMDHLTDAIVNQRAIIVHFADVNWRWYMPSISEIAERVPLSPVFANSEGTIYQYSSR